MRITLLTNYDAASALALHYLRVYLQEQVPESTLRVFYTDKPAPLNPVPKALQALSEFERNLPQIQQLFTEAEAECHTVYPRDRRKVSLPSRAGWPRASRQGP